MMVLTESWECVPPDLKHLHLLSPLPISSMLIFVYRKFCGASIRIPIGTVERGWKGWLEDRRPNSAADPYKVAARIVKTVRSAEAQLTKLVEAQVA